MPCTCSPSKVHFDCALSVQVITPGIGDIAASALLAALPSDLVELGLVGCCLTDRSGEEALHFMLRSTGLKVMCVEDNDFSQTMKARIEQAGLSLAGCLLVV